jgi:hypothetical protein
LCAPFDVITVHLMEFLSREALALDLGVTVPTDSICRAGIGGRVLDDEVVVANAPTFLGVAVDLAIANYHDGQNAESTGEAGPEAVPTAGLVERTGPTEKVMEEGVETVHQLPHFVMRTRLISDIASETDTSAWRALSWPMTSASKHALRLDDASP